VGDLVLERKKRENRAPFNFTQVKRGEGKRESGPSFLGREIHPLGREKIEIAISLRPLLFRREEKRKRREERREEVDLSLTITLCVVARICSWREKGGGEGEEHLRTISSDDREKKRRGLRAHRAPRTPRSDSLEGRPPKKEGEGMSEKVYLLSVPQKKKGEKKKKEFENCRSAMVVTDFRGITPERERKDKGGTPLHLC